MLPRAGLRTLLGARHRVVRGAPSPRATLHHLAKRPPRRAPAPHHRVLSSKAKRDYYEVLGVPRSAAAAVKRRWCASMSAAPVRAAPATL